MPSQSLYRKWRPQTFRELVAQDHVSRTLLNALRDDKIVHAYLFAGPRGTGKTSAARILAKAVNCLTTNGKGEPCNTCEVCQAINDGRAIDLIEIDAASNRGIDEIRDLRDKVAFSPTLARRKVYIIDEVHQLTPEAFNALLKTLEEPPGHVLFILATTEAHKVPATIVSRCQRFDFHRIPLTAILERLKEIATAEGINIEPAAMEYLARVATGAMRDAISLLDQLSSYGAEGITLEFARQVLGGASSQAVVAMANALVQGDAPAGLKLINQVAGDGVDLRQFTRDLIEYLRGLMLIKTGTGHLLNVPTETRNEMAAQASGIKADALIRAIRLLSQADQALRGAAIPQLPLELAYLEIVLPDGSAPASRPAAAALTEGNGGVRPALPAARTTPPLVRINNGGEWHEATAAPVTTGSADATTPTPTGTVGGWNLETVRAEWPKVLEILHQGNRSLEVLLKDYGQIVAFERGAIILAFPRAPFRDRVEDPRHREVIGKAVEKIYGRGIAVRAVLLAQDGSSPRPVADVRVEKIRQAEEDPTVKAALRIFPGAEIADVE